MKTQLKTIRAGLEAATCYTMMGADAHSVQIALAALAQLEAMVGEPVAWRVHPFDYGIGHEGVYATTHLTQQRDAWLRKGWNVESLYTAAPVAQQPQEIEVQCPVCNHKFYEWPNDKQPQAEAVPMFWVRLRSDGMYEGPIHNTQIERVRVQSGAWSPLYLGAVPSTQKKCTCGQWEACHICANTNPSQKQAEAVLGMYEHKCPSVTGHRGPSFVCQKAGHAVGQNSYCNECPAAPQQAEAVPSDVVCEKDPMGCWNVRCQLGKVCKNASMKQGNQP